MNALSILLILLTFVSLLMIINKDKINMKFILVFVLINLAVYFIHSFFGLYGWQLIPLYFVTFMLFALSYKTPKKKLYRVFIISLSSFLLLFSIALLYAFPISVIPKPRGSYEIGLRTFIIKDLDRLELYTDDINDTREFVINMWYPAGDISNLDQALWINHDGVYIGLAKSMGLPQIALSQITKVKAHAYIDAPINQTQDKYPVVIISHGWGGFMNLHTDLAEELASLGYIVISIDHTYGSVSTALSDQTVYQNMDALPNREDSDFLDDANQLVYTYAGDISKTLDYLEAENELSSNAFFKGKLDLDAIGLLGHSTGGGADVAVALNDDRIKALIGLDAWVEPILSNEVDKGLSMPSIFLRSETWEEGPNNNNLYQLIQQSTNASLYQIDHTTHSDFSMAYMFSPLMHIIGFTGSLDTDYLVDMQKDIIVKFFDEYLKGEINETIDLTIYKELEFIQVA